MSKKLKNQKGFTLVEVMISMVILAIGVLGLAPMMVTAMYGNAFSKDVTSAAFLAQDSMERLKNQSVITPIPYTQTDNGLFNVYNRTIRVDDFGSDGTVPPNVFRILVTMTWTDKKGVSRSETYSTYKMK
jgi:type IV pilus assembly protein PilV